MVRKKASKPYIPDPILEASCQEQSPSHDKVKMRVRCNRPKGHDGPHRRYRAADFKMLAEWLGLTYTLFPNGEKEE